METEKKPTKLYFLINIAVIVVIVVFAGYAYLKFFADKSEENGEGTDIEKEKPKSNDVSKQVSGGAFKLAIFLGVILITVYLVTLLRRKESSRFV